MSDIIQLLPDAVASQIAAGEVIQRPASVVKELMENAIDAGADKIQLIIKDSGKSLIQIIDNGCGMSETDARMCFERHATSKLRQADDLNYLHTMGFRGEAMATIAAIAQVELKTRLHAQDMGVKILMEGSEVKQQEPCQASPGTSISVKNLFYNVPARRNFLKSNAVEMRHILDEFQRLALANPELFFSLHHNGSENFHLPAGNLRQRIVGIFGKNYNKRLVPVEESTDIIKLSGFVGKPEFAKKTRGDQFFFVNNRFIKSSYLHHAVTSAFDELLPKGTHPFYVLNIQIDPARIDVNVHPTKQEIKFDDERLMYNYLKVTVRHALGQHNITPTLDFEQGGSFSSTRLSGIKESTDYRPISSKANADRTFSSGATSSNIRQSAASSSSAGSSITIPSNANSQRQANNLKNWESLYEGLDEQLDNTSQTETVPSSEPAPNLLTLESRISSDQQDGPIQQDGFKKNVHPYQIHNRYIISSIKSGYILIDQQSAHERILYEQFLDTLSQQQAVSQQQLFAQTLNLSPADTVLLTEMLPQIKLLGFDIEPFGQNAFVINGVPAEIAGKKNELEIIDSLIEQYRSQLELKLDIKENIARAMARSAATSSGQQLSNTEMQYIINRLFACKNPMRSPSGRACFITYDLDELDRKFCE